MASGKGGSGKSTLACNLAIEACRCGLRVALVDADPQATAALWSERREHAKMSDESVSPDVARFDPAEVRNASAAAADYDLLVIDTAGRLSVANDALAMADLVLVPCRVTIADVEAAVWTLQLAAQVAMAAAVVFSQVPARGDRRVTQVEESLADDLEEAGRKYLVAPVRIGMRYAYSDALAYGLSVSEYETDGKAADEIRRLWRWISAQIYKGDTP